MKPFFNLFKKKTDLPEYEGAVGKQENLPDDRYNAVNAIDAQIKKIQDFNSTDKNEDLQDVITSLKGIKEKIQDLSKNNDDISQATKDVITSLPNSAKLGGSVKAEELLEQVEKSLTKEVLPRFLPKLTPS